MAFLVYTILCLLLCARSGIAAVSSQSLCSNETTANDVLGGQSLAHRVAIVTGGDSGLGYAIAEAVARAGATVVIASHNLEKTQVAANNITALGGGIAVGMHLDLGLLDSVRTFAAQFLKNFTTLNYLFNNAGISGSGNMPYETSDGFESVYEVDYLGHFLLTELLLPVLRKNKGFSPSRIINTASTAHVFACSSAGLPDDCFRDWKYIPTPIFNKSIVRNGTKQNVSTYGMAKFANIQHAAELAVREKDNLIETFSVCPGLVLTGMTGDLRNSTYFCEMIRSNYGMDQYPCPYTPEQGAAVLATSALSAKEVGAWYTRYTGCSDSKPVVQHGFTAAMRAELYDRSLHWVRLTQGKADDLLLV